MSQSHSMMSVCASCIAPLVLTVLIALASPSPPTPFAAVLTTDSPMTRRMSLSSQGAQANAESSYPVLSADGHFVAFASSASNLVVGDTNETGDIFVKDCTSGSIVCASMKTDGMPASGESYSPSISADGQRVVFASEAADLVADDTNKMSDVFLRDVVAHTTTRLSASAAGEQADGPSVAPRISSDGRFVAFASLATNLVPGDTNGVSDVFVRDVQAGTIERVSIGVGGEPANGPSEGASISADGRYVAFASTAINLLAGGDGWDPVRVWDVYVRDRVSGTTVRVSGNPSGGKGNGHSHSPAISADGHRVAFTSLASNLISSDLNERSDIYVRDLVAGTTVRASVGVGGQEASGESARSGISADGRFVVFESNAQYLVQQYSTPGSTWCYLRDLVNGTTIRVVSASADTAADGGASNAAISADGRWIAFSSAEPSLVGGDSNEIDDVFVRGPMY
jgi:Tol biopolymer transport system component